MVVARPDEAAEDLPGAAAQAGAADRKKKSGRKLPAKVQVLPPVLYHLPGGYVKREIGEGMGVGDIG